MIDREAAFSRAPVLAAPGSAAQFLGWGALTELQSGTVVVKEDFILLGEGILRLGEDPSQVFLGELVERGDDGEPADQFGDHAVPLEVFGGDLGHQLSRALELAPISRIVTSGRSRSSSGPARVCR